MANCEIERNHKKSVFVKSNADIYRFFQANDTIIVNDISEFDGRAGFLFGRRKHGAKFSNINDQTLVLALHEGVIEPEIWLKCQYKLSRNRQIKRTGIGKTTWLSGLVRCGKCGNTMKITKSKTKAGRYLTAQDAASCIYVKDITVQYMPMLSNT